MAIAKRTNVQGRTTGYTVTVSVPNPTGGRGKRYTIGTYRLRRDAEAAERDAVSAIQRGEFDPTPPAPPKVLTVRDVAEAWLADRKAHVTPNTHAQYASAFRLHLQDAIGACDITALTRADVRALVRSWQAAELGAQLQHRSLLVLRCALEAAVDDGLIAANPAIGIKLPSPKRRRDLPLWTPEHLTSFLAEAERNALGAFWYLTALEGLRRAEALGLRWRDLRWSEDESTCTATIVQTVVPDAGRGGAALVQARAKTRGSQRTVSLTGPTVAALRRHRDRQAFRRRELMGSWSELDLIVCNEVGEPIRPDRVDTHREAVMSAAGVPVIRTHDLRHQAVSVMLSEGTSIAIVAQKVGHTDTSTTFTTYGHLVPEDQKQANDAIEGYLNRAKAAGGA